MNLRTNAESSSAKFYMSPEESLESGGDTTGDNTDTIAYAFSEVATLNGSGEEFLFKQQDQVR
jgi:hypothetical protein